MRKSLQEIISLSTDKIYLYTAIVLSFILTLVFHAVPFFWDNVAFSEAAHYLLEQEFSTLILPTELDTGSFPLYSLCMALCWSIFGKTLWVSHFFILIVFIGILFEFHRFARLFLNSHGLGFAFLLLFAEPTLLTQTLIMGYDLIYVYAFLLCVNGILYKRNLSLGWGMIILLLSGQRAIVAGIAIFLIDFLIRRKKISLDFFLPYLIPGLMGLSWMIYHYLESGWLFFNPLREGTHEFLVEPLFAIKRTGFVIWKLLDFGRVAWWCLLAVGVITAWRQKDFKGEQQSLWIILVVPLFFLISIIVPFSVPVAHRYFLITFVVGTVLTVYYLSLLFQKRNQKVIAAVVLVLVLFTGNHWQYPERFGNGWDASLKVLPYFPLKKELRNYVKEEGLDQQKIATEFPLSMNFKHSELLEEDFQLADLDTQNPNDFSYFVHSNIINSAFPDQTKNITQTWTLKKEWEKKGVFVRLYQRPDLAQP